MKTCANPLLWLRRRGTWFLAETGGTVTTEFVIIFPIVMALLFLIAFISMFISAASDVQQLAHELARAAFGLASSKTPGQDICATLRTDVLPGLLRTSLLVNEAKLSLQPCPAQPTADGYFTVEVRYNFAGDYVASLANNFGLELGTLRRTSTTHF